MARCLHPAPPRGAATTSRELSICLAELARAIRDRIKAALAIEIDTGPLTMLMKTFQEALVHDLDADSFADMYAQTIAYGLLSARIEDPEKKTADDFAAHCRYAEDAASFCLFSLDAPCFCTRQTWPTTR